MRMLNLDAVRKPLGEFTLGGVVYTVWPMRVGQLLNLAAIPTTDIEGNSLAAVLEMIHGSVPDCSIEALRQLDLVQLNALSSWIQGTADEDAEKNSAPLPEGAPAAGNAPPILAGSGLLLTSALC